MSFTADATSRMAMIESRWQKPLPELILEMYWVYRNWDEVAGVLDVTRATLLAWRNRFGITDDDVKQYVRDRIASGVRRDD